MRGLPPIDRRQPAADLGPERALHRQRAAHTSTSAPPSGVTYHGPYDDSAFTSAHDVVADPFTGGDDSRLCGQCHQVDNPDEHLYDASGKDTGKPFPLDTTYEEWQQSSFASGATAQSCQACHMPAQTGSYPVGSGAGNRDNPPRHDFVGGNDWGPALLKAAFPGTARRAVRLHARRRAGEPEARRRGSRSARSRRRDRRAATSTWRVRVTNLSRPQVPDRLRGRTPRLARGRGRRRHRRRRRAVRGLRRGDGRCWSRTTQLRLYEAVHGRDGNPEDHIVLHRQILRDSRIPPAGFHATPATQIDRADHVLGRGGRRRELRRRHLPRRRCRTPSATDVTVRVRLVFQAMTAPTSPRWRRRTRPTTAARS